MRGIGERVMLCIIGGLYPAGWTQTLAPNSLARNYSLIALITVWSQKKERKVHVNLVIFIHVVSEIN